MSFDTITLNQNVEKNPKKNQKKKSYGYISFIVYMETEDIYVDIAKDVDARFDTQIMSWVDHYLSKN